MDLKSQDCHVLIQQLLPVVFRVILPTFVRGILTCLCLFFNAICKKFIDPRVLDDLENEAIRLLCKLKMYFPPSFFQYHGSFDNSSCERNSIIWASFLEMDIPNGEIHEDLKGICQ